jgi:hypothetical protein
VIVTAGGWGERRSGANRTSSCKRYTPKSGFMTPRRVRHRGSSPSLRVGEAARRADRLNRRVRSDVQLCRVAPPLRRCPRTEGRSLCLSFSTGAAGPPRPEGGFRSPGRCGSFEGRHAQGCTAHSEGPGFRRIRPSLRRFPVCSARRVAVLVMAILCCATAGSAGPAPSSAGTATTGAEKFAGEIVAAINAFRTS